MQILAPQDVCGIFSRVLFFTAVIAAANVAFAWAAGPYLPSNRLLYQLINAAIVGTPFIGVFFVVMMFQVRLQRRLCHLSRKDGLTGLNNRDTFFDLAAKCNKRYQTGILLLLDADHFKQINDTYGHQAGDNCLKSIAYMLQRNLRDEDVTGRIGGEEFAILLANASVEQAHFIAERLTRPIPFRGGPENQHLTVTLSVGAVVTSPDQPLDLLFAQADRALYQAKSEGRARIVFANDLAPTAKLQMAL
ncbi:MULTISPECIES: GGDEF domain-containing protein [unclassified Yoonia]|uniref:GGDEF domain-containing protein n=1 Tax=unclassified Yoonia TaxID=2629118 RepID=UPI002AFE9C3A|nr:MULTISPECIES: GGDEF domain-containing protein [unclassified Yoonia]